MVKGKNLINNKIGQLKMHKKDLEVSKYTLKDNLSSSHRAQVAENKTLVLIIRLAEFPENSSPSLSRC